MRRVIDAGGGESRLAGELRWKKRRIALNIGRDLRINGPPRLIAGSRDTDYGLSWSHHDATQLLAVGKMRQLCQP
jgi:hypothetical protein